MTQMDARAQSQDYQHKLTARGVTLSPSDANNDRRGGIINNARQLTIGQYEREVIRRECRPSRASASVGSTNVHPSRAVRARPCSYAPRESPQNEPCLRTHGESYLSRVLCSAALFQKAVSDLLNVSFPIFSDQQLFVDPEPWHRMPIHQVRVAVDGMRARAQGCFKRD